MSISNICYLSFFQIIHNTFLLAGYLRDVYDLDMNPRQYIYDTIHNITFFPNESCNKCHI